MMKDYKTGLVVGLVLLIITSVWLSIQPSLSVGKRLKDQNDNQEPKPDISDMIKREGRQEESQKSTETGQETTIPGDQDFSNSENEQGKDSDDFFQPEIVVPFTLNKTKFHTVVKDDTLIGLAEQYYGSTNLWTKIRDANPHIDVYNLKVGTQLVIPPP